MACETKKIDSSVVGLKYAQEGCYGKLPDAVADSGAEDAGVWLPLDPNDYPDFGGEVKTVARSPINDSRQRRKGVVVDVEASGGFQQDLTPTNLTKLMQGFFFSDAKERIGNKPLNDLAASTAGVVSITGTNVINVATGKGSSFAVGMLLKTSGFVNAANNVPVMKITAIATDALTISGATLTAETYSTGRLEVVGFEFTDLQISYASNVLKLTSTIGFSTKAFQVGEWIFIGGDDTANQFALGGSGENKPGYARVEKVEANALTLKEPTFTPLTNSGSGKSVRVFVGAFLKNESASNIKKRSYQLERTLGNDGDGVQSEVLTGCIPNELTINIPAADKITMDLAFEASKRQVRTGAQGLKLGTRTATLLIEDAYNSSSDVYRQRLFVHGTVPTPSSLFAYVTDAKLSINNNAKGNKAIGNIGNFSISVGDFEVSGSLEVYFTDVDAVRAIENNSDVGFNTIIAARNTGIVYDIPLLTLGGGKIKVAKDTPIMLPLEKMAAQNANGYTFSATYFSYLPTVAMPST